MIDNRIVEYIANNKHLLKDDVSKFLYKAQSKLKSTLFEDLIELLRGANIDIEPILDQILINKLNFTFSFFVDGQSLIELIDEELLDEGNTTFIGKTHDQLVDFILKHETLWEDSMYLAIGYDGDVLVRKN